MCHLKASKEVTNMVSSAIAISPVSHQKCLESIEFQIIRSWNLGEKVIRFAFDTGEDYRGGIRISRSQFVKVESEKSNVIDGIEWAFSPF